MRPRGLLTMLLVAAAALILSAGGSLAAARAPQVLPTVGETFAAPYDAVWEATLKGLGAVKAQLADKTRGQIETEDFPFAFAVGAGIDRGTQVIWVSFAIAVRADGQRTHVQVQPRVHHALLNGFTPGPISNPWVDLFARIRGHLGRG